MSSASTDFHLNNGYALSISGLSLTQLPFTSYLFKAFDKLICLKEAFCGIISKRILDKARKKMEAVYIKDLFEGSGKYAEKEIQVSGWIRSVRASNKFGFIVLNDGTYFENLQIVMDAELDNYDELSKLNVGSAIIAKGLLVETPQAKQPFELKATSIKIEGESTSDYPLQKKRHGLEFLRTIPHLRPRTNTFNAVFRIRSLAAFALHKFFNERGFVYVHTPIITGSDAEGAGQMFRVTTLPMENLPKDDKGNINYEEDFFSKEANLTVSGQLNVETYAMAFRKVYTFGPTFRAENSNTPRHAAEFWMIEPEMAFVDIHENMNVAEDMIKYVISYVMENAPEEMNFFNKFIDKGLIDRLKNIVENKFERITYTKAVELIKSSGKKFEYKINWGDDLQTEHERYITEEVYKKPVFVIDYPKDIKAFYMKLNDDGKTVSAMDLLVPNVGEIIGGSQREDDYDKLLGRMKEMNLDESEYDWYLDLRKYGTAVHSGYGLGFERLIMYMTGMSNIRDVVSFPRTVNNLNI